MGGRQYMRVRNSEAIERKAALLNPQAREELRRVQRPNGCEDMADWFIAKGWFNVGPNGDIVLHKKPTLKTREEAIEGIRLLTRLEKVDPRNITYGLLRENGFRGGIARFFDGSLYETINACFPEAGIQPWELKDTPNGFFDDPENRRRAYYWLAESRPTKDPIRFTVTDFEDSGLSGLIGHPDIGRNLWRLKREVYPERRPWELPKLPTRLNLSAEDLREMVITKSKDLGIDPIDIPRERIPRSVLLGHGGILNLLIDAGVVTTEEDRRHVETRRTRRSAEVRALRAAQRKGADIRERS